MNQLVAYTPENLKNFDLRSELSVQANGDLCIVFQIQNRSSEIVISEPPFSASTEQVKRKDELWKNTCFEFFLKPTGFEKYYEFNFNLQPAWNCYLFEKYRTPQPPLASSDFEVLSFNWDGQNMEIVLKNNSSFKKFNVGITAIIKDIKNQTHYFALKHAGEKPDFHLQNSFILQRGS